MEVAKQVGPAQERRTERLSCLWAAQPVVVVAYQSSQQGLCYDRNVRCAEAETVWSWKLFCVETWSHSCQTFRRHPPVRLSRPNNEGGEVYQPLRVHCCDFGRHRTYPLLCWDLCTFEFLGLFCAVRTFADPHKYGFLDILVHGEHQGVWRGAQPDQTRHTVRQYVWSRAGRAGLLQPSSTMTRKGLKGQIEAEASSKIMNMWAWHSLKFCLKWRMCDKTKSAHDQEHIWLIPGDKNNSFPPLRLQGKTTCHVVCGQHWFLDFVGVENVFLSTFIGRKLLKMWETVCLIYVVIMYIMIWYLYFNISLHIHVRCISFWN